MNVITAGPCAVGVDNVFLVGVSYMFTSYVVPTEEGVWLAG
jgi:hypothetical protein